MEVSPDFTLRQTEKLERGEKESEGTGHTIAQAGHLDSQLPVTPKDQVSHSLWRGGTADNRCTVRAMLLCTRAESTDWLALRRDLAQTGSLQCS